MTARQSALLRPRILLLGVDAEWAAPEGTALAGFDVGPLQRAAIRWACRQVERDPALVWLFLCPRRGVVAPPAPLVSCGARPFARRDYSGQLRWAADVVRSLLDSYPRVTLDVTVHAWTPCVRALGGLLPRYWELNAPRIGRTAHQRQRWYERQLARGESA